MQPGFLLSACLLSVCLAKHKQYLEYCQQEGEEEERCDETGLYREIQYTSYQDFLIRHILDIDIDTVNIKPKVGLKKTIKTFRKYPDSPRAVLNLGIFNYH